MEKYDFDSYVMRNVPSENWLTSLVTAASSICGNVHPVYDDE